MRKLQKKPTKSKKANNYKDNYNGFENKLQSILK